VAALLGLAGLELLTPDGVLGQSRWTLTPSLNVSERFDTNIFLTATDRKSDFVTDVTPGIAIKLEDPTLQLSAGYSIAGQVYADNSDLDNTGDNQSAFLGAHYLASPRLTLDATAYFARTSETQTFLRPPAVPADVTVTTLPTIESQRKISNQGTLNVGAGYQLDQTTSVTARYSFAATDNTTGSSDLDMSHTVGLGVAQQVTAIDQITLDGTIAVFDTSETVTTYTVLAGWARQWTAALRSNIALGPQVSDGHWLPAGTLDIAYKPDRQLSLSLVATQGTSLVVGGTDPAAVSTARATIGYQATRTILLAGFGYIQRTAPLDDLGSSNATTDYAVGASATYQITTWMAMQLRYQFTLQDGGPGSTGNIPDHQVVLGLTFSYPFAL
jgi:hypothetical protein